MAEALFPLLKEEALLAADFGADHPRLKSVRLQIEMTRKHLQELAGMDPLPVVPGEEVKPPEDILTVYLQSLRQELQIYEKQQTDLRAMAQREEDLARSLAQEMVDDRNKQAEIDRLSKLFEGVTLQINELKVNAGMGGRDGHSTRTGSGRNSGLSHSGEFSRAGRIPWRLCGSGDWLPGRNGRPQLPQTGRHHSRVWCSDHGSCAVHQRVTAEVCSKGCGV